MKNTPFQMRLKAAKLTQRLMAELVGTTDNTMSRWTRGQLEVPTYVFAALVAWELMSDDQRATWLKEIRTGERPSNKVP